MKHSLMILLGALTVAASCARENTAPAPSAAPVSIRARIADETKANLHETDGSFAFTGVDAIKIYNGTGTYSSTSVTLDGGTATFTMQDGFTDSGSGFAACPASSVSAISASGVTFTLPDTYTYAQAGGTDASTSQVPCLMMASYTAGEDLEFKQAGAVIRFRVKNCLAGNLTFTFKSQVTGTVTLSAVPSGTDDGIQADHFLNNNGGYSITVTGVPEASGDEFFFITLPVPIDTDPMNVSVWNDGGTEGRFATLSGTPVLLKRANGYKRGVTLEERAAGNTFGGFSIAGFLYNDNEETNKEEYYKILTDPLALLTHFEQYYSDAQYYFSWNEIVNSIPKLFTAEGITIGTHKYDVPTGGNYGQWKTIVGTDRPAAKVNGANAHYAFVQVTGLDTETYPNPDIRGLLLFPDNANIAITATTGVSLAAFDAASENASNTIPLDVLRDLEEKGCVFLPMAGYSETYKGSDKWGDLNVGGYFWSRTNYYSSYAYALAITYDESSYTLAPKNSYDDKSRTYFPILLIRCD